MDGVGSGKSRTALYYYFTKHGGQIDINKYVKMKDVKDLYIITTARKRDTLEWEAEMGPFMLSKSEPKLYKHNYWLNTLDESKGIIIEENLVHVIINEKNIPQYRYVFVRKIDETSKEYFEFIGVFKLLKYKNKFKRIWKKIDTDEYVTLDLSKYE